VNPSIATLLVATPAVTRWYEAVAW